METAVAAHRGSARDITDIRILRDRLHTGNAPCVLYGDDALVGNRIRVLIAAPTA